MAPWDILFAVEESDFLARIQAFIDGYADTGYEVHQEFLFTSSIACILTSS